MKAFISVASLLLCVSGVCADDLDDAWAICKEHKDTTGKFSLTPRAPLPPYTPVWEHCNRIEDSWLQRKKAQDDADEAKNPDLKKTRDLAKRLPR